MAYFLAVYRQADGCDYTIGCGVQVGHFEATDRAAAVTYVINHVSDPDVWPDEIANSIEQVSIIELQNFEWLSVGPNCWKAERERRISDHERVRNEEKEKKEFARLRKKFEGQ